MPHSRPSPAKADLSPRAATIGFVSSPHYIDHLTGPYHPERPDRIRAVHRAVRAAGMLDSADPFPDFELDLGALDGGGVKLREFRPRHAHEKWALTVHSREHVNLVRHICEIGGGVIDQGDTPVSRDSYDVALFSLGALLVCCDRVMDGTVQRAFAASRPPGHHAEPDRAMGFCLFSNIAIAARYLQQRHHIGKVAIVDFDVHHGNGTQACLEADPTTLFISLHQHPRTCYPGSGYDWEIGTGAGEGFTLNVPFAPASGDGAYLDAMHEKVIPKINAFAPDFLLISAGFDAHQDDPLAQMDLTEDCFEQMTRMLVQAAQRHCGGRIVSALEGGYDLRAMGRSVVRHLRGLHSG